MNKFRIAINMAGAISAGAYTAGVLDFLVEALDAWYQAKTGDEFVPTHSVSIVSVRVTHLLFCLVWCWT